MTERKNRLLTMKTSEAERQLLRHQAEQRGTTVSGMIRTALERDGVKLSPEHSRA